MLTGLWLTAFHKCWITPSNKLLNGDPVNSPVGYLTSFMSKNPYLLIREGDQWKTSLISMGFVLLIVLAATPFLYKTETGFLIFIYIQVVLVIIACVIRYCKYHNKRSIILELNDEGVKLKFKNELRHFSWEEIGQIIIELARNPAKQNKWEICFSIKTTRGLYASMFLSQYIFSIYYTIRKTRNIVLRYTSDPEMFISTVPPFLKLFFLRKRYTPK